MFLSVLATPHLCGVVSGELPFSGNLHGLQPTECGGSGGTCMTSEARS